MFLGIGVLKDGEASMGRAVLSRRGPTPRSPAFASF